MKKQWSSVPRPVVVIEKANPQNRTEVASVAAAARHLGIEAQHASGMLSGRTGKRSEWKLEYVDGLPSRAVA